MTNMSEIHYGRPPCNVTELLLISQKSASKSHALRAWMKFFQYFRHFLSDLSHTSRQDLHKNLLTYHKLHWISAVKDTQYWQTSTNFTHTFHISCLIWVKLGTRILQIMLLSFYEFHENWCRDVILFLSA